MTTSRSKLNEQIRYEIKLFESLLSQKPHYAEALVALADLYTKIGEIKKGLVLDERLAVLLPDDDTVFYNLACSLCLTGQIKKAYEALKQAVDLGYDDLEHLKHDSDLKLLRKSKIYGPKLRLLLPSKK